MQETNHKVVQFAHKVIIEDFHHYLEDDFWKDTLFVTEKFETDQFISYLKLRPNNIDQSQDKNLSIFVCFKLSEKCETEVKFKISVFDCDGKCFFKKVNCNVVDNRDKNAWQFDVEVKTVEENIKITDQITILCEISAAPKTFDSSKLIELNEIYPKIEHSGGNKDSNCNIIETALSGNPRIVESIVHNWKIDHFRHLNSDEWKYDLIHSKDFTSERHVFSNFSLTFRLNEDEEDECTNNFSVALFHSSLIKEEVSVRMKISILDENGHKCNTRGAICIFDKNQNRVAFREYISVLDLLKHSNGFVKDDKLNLHCEIQILKNKEMDNDSAEFITTTSESYFNPKPRVVDSFAHKWTIENFRCFYREEWKIEGIFPQMNSRNFYSNLNKHKFNICLYPNGKSENSNGNVSLYLNYSNTSSENVDVIARWKFSIINDMGERLNSQGVQNIFNEKQYNFGYEKYISVSSLLDQSNGYLQNDKLILNCQIQIIDNEYQQSTEEFNLMEFMGHFVSDIIRSLNESVQSSKFAHKWTIHNFSCALQNDSNAESALVSCKFWAKSHNFAFYLKLFPNGIDEDVGKYVSLILCVELFQEIELILKCKISIIDANGDKLTFADEEASYDRVSSIQYGKFIAHNDLQEKFLLNDDTLTLFCEISAIENVEKINLLNMDKYAHYSELSELKLNDIDVIETVTNAKAAWAKSDEFTWTIDNFDKSDQNVMSLLESHPNGTSIESSIFPLRRNQHNFFLLMSPNGENEDKKDRVSIYLGVVSFEKRQVTCQFKISLIDCTGNKLHTKKQTFRFKHNEAYGFTSFISHEELLNPANGLITNNKLTVHCEVNYVDEEKIVETPYKNIDIIEKASSIKNLNHNLTFSFTQPTSHAHLWVIENFGVYFQSIQDQYGQYVETNQFSHASNDQVKFVLRLYPKYKKIDYNDLLIYYNLISNQNQDLTTSVTTSILDENNKKLFTVTHLVDHWPIGPSFNWEQLQVDPNSIDKLKILFEYNQYKHYSSISEMNQHENQFAIDDDFYNSWKVKRLIDVQSQSETYTCINVRPCHFELQISDFTNQDGSCKSSTFFPPDNEKLQFYLRMISHSQDKMSICLCLDSFEQNEKICIRITILDKNGVELETKSGFAQLFDGESEYDCLEPFENISDLQDENLMIHCELNFLGNQTCTPVNIPTKAILPELNELLNNGPKSNIILHFVGDKQLHAHRLILSARSNVFEAMFRHDSIEAQQNKVEITDLDIEIFEHVLRFMYTGQVEFTLQNSALELMIAADKYGLTELKEKCQEWLCENITTETVFDCLAWSDKLEAIKLKEISIEYFHKHAKELSKTNVLKDFFKSKPELFIELYLNSIDRNMLQKNKYSDNLDHELDVR